MSDEIRHEFASVAEAKAFISKRRPGRTRYMLQVAAILPTDDGHYFPGSAAIVVSKSEMTETIEKVCRTFVDKRGARAVIYESESFGTRWFSFR